MNTLVAVLIDGTVYHLTQEPKPGPAVVRMFKLSKAQQGPAGRQPESYYVKLMADGKPVCSCPDFTYRAMDAGERCKHAEALTRAGLLRS